MDIIIPRKKLFSVIKDIKLGERKMLTNPRTMITLLVFSKLLICSIQEL